MSTLHEIDPSLPIHRLGYSLYDHCESSLPLGSNVVGDTPWIDLEDVFDSPFTSLPLVAPSFSSTPTDTSVSDSTLLASSLHLAYCMGLEMGEASRRDASVLEDVWSEELELIKPCLEEAPFEEPCGDIVMGSSTPNTGLIDLICIKPPDSTPISSPLPPTTPSFMHAFHESLGDIRAYHPFF